MPSELPRLVTRVPEDIYNMFLKICEEQGRTSSNLLSFIVKKYIESYGIVDSDSDSYDHFPTYNEKLANAINNALKKNNITDEQLLKNTSISQKYLERLKNGYLPPFLNALEIMMYLRFKLSDIVELTSKSEKYVTSTITKCIAEGLRFHLVHVNMKLNEICNDKSNIENKISEIYELNNYVNSIISSGLYDTKLLMDDILNKFNTPVNIED